MDKQFKNALEKRFGKDVLMPGINFYDDSERVSTGSLGLDYATGGGWPRGKLILIKGPESSGKTYLAYKAMAQLTQAGEECVVLDIEGAYEASWAEACGVDISKVLVHRSEFAETSLDLMEVLTASKQFGGIFLDSIAALLPKDEKEASTEDWQMGLGARLMNKTLRKVQGALNEASNVKKGKAPLVMMINQLREKIGVMFGSPETMPYGKGQLFFAQVIADVRSNGIDEDGWAKSVVKFPKNKTAPPKRIWGIAYYVDGPKKGKMDNIHDLITYGEESGVIVANSGWYKVKGAKKAIREKALHENIAKDEKFRNKLLDLAMETFPEDMARHKNYEWL